mmetsp:Transcript_16215/g.50946  ORF Transcript_16215/g.50946 Transcript_16215/m.50946 type:complete len:287 (+) Transcript_16215:1109-1969(+)
MRSLRKKSATLLGGTHFPVDALHHGAREGAARRHSLADAVVAVGLALLEVGVVAVHAPLLEDVDVRVDHEVAGHAVGGERDSSSHGDDQRVNLRLDPDILADGLSCVVRVRHGCRGVRRNDGAQSEGGAILAENLPAPRGPFLGSPPLAQVEHDAAGVRDDEEPDPLGVAGEHGAVGVGVMGPHKHPARRGPRHDHVLVHPPGARARQQAERALGGRELQPPALGESDLLEPHAAPAQPGVERREVPLLRGDEVRHILEAQPVDRGDARGEGVPSPGGEVRLEHLP